MIRYEDLEKVVKKDNGRFILCSLRKYFRNCCEYRTRFCTGNDCKFFLTRDVTWYCCGECSAYISGVPKILSEKEIFTLQVLLGEKGIYV